MRPEFFKVQTPSLHFEADHDSPSPTSIPLCSHHLLKRCRDDDGFKCRITISKPAKLRDHQLNDYFNLSFTTLSHKLLRPDAFEADISQLRGRFTDKGRGDHVSKPAHHKRIPADGVAFYTEGI